MNIKTLNKVRVRKNFPGFNEGDVLVLDTETGLFVFSYNVNEVADEDAFNSLSSYLGEYKPSLSKDTVLENMDFFVDISEYQMKGQEQLGKRVEELKTYIQAYKSKDMFTPEDEAERNKAITVWQNLIWELEWVLGQRTI